VRARTIGVERVAGAKDLSKEEVVKLQRYLRKLFGTDALQVRARQKAADAAEVYLRNEFVGVVAKDVEDGDTCYQMNLTILEYDLDEA
jgi:hypothetical protein